LAHKNVGQIADHLGDVIGKLNTRPALIGHSFGGLLTQILAGRGAATVSVAIDPAPFRGVLPLPLSALKSAAPVIGNPANRGAPSRSAMTSSGLPSPTPSPKARRANCTTPSPCRAQVS